MVTTSKRVVTKNRRHRSGDLNTRMLGDEKVEHRSNKESRTKVAIACQGGGSHSAFTAGVLTEILENFEALKSKGYDIVGFSGTSGGAMCAALACYGLRWTSNLHAGLATRMLKEFWEANTAGSLQHIANARWSDWFPFLSPIWLNSLVLNRCTVAAARQLSSMGISIQPPTWVFDRDVKDFLRSLLRSVSLMHKAVGNETIPSLLIGAVNVESGEFHVFKNEQVTVDALLASAAIPTVFEAVTIDDKDSKGVYWDGLYSQNPPLRQFFDLEPPEDRARSAQHRLKAKQHRKDEKPDQIWIIRVNPKQRQHQLMSTAEKLDRRNELVGNLSLQQELDSIDAMNALIDLFPESLSPCYKKVTYSDGPLSIDEQEVGELLDVSKLDRTPQFIARLWEHGRNRARVFVQELLGEHGGGNGRKPETAPTQEHVASAR
jgi:NTE family protein